MSNDDINERIRRAEQEAAGQRLPSAPPISPNAQPVYGEATPIPPQPQPQAIRLALPFSPAWAYMVLLVINIAVFAVPTVLQLGGVRVQGIPINDYVLYLGAKDNQAIKVGGEYWRFLTAMFLHGGLLHIAFNAYALYAIGPQAERLYGTARFVALYFIAGFAGGIASYALSSSLSVGASGAIFGLIGGLASFFYLNRRTLGDMARQQLGSLITVIMLNLFIGFSGGGAIDNFAHLGGLFGGLVLGALLAPRYTIDDRVYPPVVVRNNPAIGWVGAAAVLAILCAAAVVINPPLS